MKKTKGIYCLEVGEWFNSLKKRSSVEPILQLLHESPLAVPYIHRDIATDTELRYYLRKWTQGRHKDYPILYLAFHGNPGCIQVRKENGKAFDYDTDDLFKLLEGKCHRRIIHFGSCSVLNIHGHTVNRYIQESGAASISGYADDVDWVTSSVFEMLYLSLLQHNQFTKPGLKAVRNKLNNMASRLCEDLKFKMRIKK